MPRPKSSESYTEWVERYINAQNVTTQKGARQAMSEAASRWREAGRSQTDRSTSRRSRR